MTQPLDKNAREDIAQISVLKTRQDFLRIAAGRKKWVSGSMIVQILETPQQGQSDAPATNKPIRVGYTASKKVGNAVKRARAKRRLREVVRKVLPHGGKEGHDYVLIARSVTVDAPFDQLIRDFGWCLKRLNQPQDQKNHHRKPSQRRRKPEQTTSGRVNK